MLFVKADDKVIDIPTFMFEELKDVLLVLLSDKNCWLDFHDYCNLVKVVDDINSHLLETNQINL